MFTVLQLVAGFGLLLVGGDLLVRGASRLAVAAGVSRLVIGLTVVAYGTSLPELAVSAQASWAGEVDIAVGNVVGSNIANLLLVLGIAAVVAPLAVDRAVVWRGLTLVIGVSLLFWLLSLDGSIGRVDGAFLFAGSVLYTFFTVKRGRAQMKREQAGQETLGDEPRVRRLAKSVLLQLGFIVLGLVFLVLGAELLVRAAVRIATSFGVSELVIGLTIVAVGTSLPEIATTLVAGRHGQRDLAVGNAIGSNLFNILMVIGLSGLLAPSGINVAANALHFDIPIMVFTVVLCLPIVWGGYLIDRSDGALLLGAYCLYGVCLYLRSIEHAALPRIYQVSLYGICPLVCLWVLAKLLVENRAEFTRKD